MRYRGCGVGHMDPVSRVAIPDLVTPQTEDGEYSEGDDQEGAEDLDSDKDEGDSETGSDSDSDSGTEREDDDDEGTYSSTDMGDNGSDDVQYDI